jgi:hypothetical protein
MNPLSYGFASFLAYLFVSFVFTFVQLLGLSLIREAPNHKEHQRQAFVNTAMNFLFPYKVQNFLTT